METAEQQIALLTQMVGELRQQITGLNRQVTEQASIATAARQVRDPTDNPQAVRFALNPIRATTALIDMASKEGVKLYKLGLEKVHSVLFDGKSENVNFFRSNVHRKALDSGWYEGEGNIFNILDDTVTPNKTYDIVYKTQEVSVNAIERFVTNNIVHKESRAAQNNYMAVKSLFDSLNEDMMKRMLADEMSYTLEDTQVAPLLFRSIILKSESPGRGQIKVLKDNFKELQDKIKGMEIDAFNDYVRGLHTSLGSFGHHMDDDDLVQHVLEAYKRSDDHLFNEHFKKKEVKWLKGEIELSFKGILQDGQAEYSSRKHNKDSSWGALSNEQQEIIALSAKVDTLKKEITQKKKSTPKEKSSLNTSTTSTGRKQDAWKFSSVIDGKTYKSGEKISKGGKDFWWCPHHYESGMWCRHKPNACTKNPDRDASQDSTAPDGSKHAVANPATEDGSDADDVEALLHEFTVDSDDE